MAEKVNMFDKANEDRRAKISEENAYVAEQIMSTKPELKQEESIVETTDNNNAEYSLKSILIKDKPSKRRCSLYLDSKIDDFFMRLGEVTGTSKSELINQLLVIAIAEDPDIQELARTNKKIKKIKDEYTNS